MTRSDVLVVGGGPGGYTAAIRAGQLGLSVTLVERDRLGGVCLNAGCIPSKALLTASNFVHAAENAASMGIYAEPYVDVGELIDWKDGVVDRLTGGVEQLCRANGVDLVDGEARFVDDETATVRRADGETETVAFDHAIVATGSRPIELPGFPFDAAPVLDAEQALSLDAAPFSLVVVGAGYVGMELSTAFAKLGTDVTVVEMLDAPLPGYEADVARVVRERAESLGVDFVFGHRATDWTRESGDVTLTTAAEDGTERRFEAERVLVAVGREPVTESLNLGALGLTPDADGFVPTDDRARTDRDHVFAVGDVAGEPLLAHVASREGVVAAETIAGRDARLDHQAVPSVVFTDPEVATVGLTEAEAADRDHDPVVGEFPFTASGRALTLDETDGFVRVVADGDGRLLGAQLVGPEASELVGELGVAIELDATLADLADAIHAHPTLSEGVMEAAAQALGAAIHTTN